MRGAYRGAHGTINGVMTGGVFRGTWCEGPTRRPKRQAGLVEWRLVQTRSGRKLVAGKWRYGYKRRPDGSFTARDDFGWNLEPLRIDEASDLERRVRTDPPEWYCRAP